MAPTAPVCPVAPVAPTAPVCPVAPTAPVTPVAPAGPILLTISIISSWSKKFQVNDGGTNGCIVHSTYPGPAGVGTPIIFHI